MTRSEKSGAYNPMHQQLVEGCKRGDQKAHFEIYRLYYRAMYNTALRIVGDPDDAEDVMQEAFLKAFSRLKTYRGEVSLGAWLKKIVIHKALDFIRLRRYHIPLEEVGEIEERPDEQLEETDIKFNSEFIKQTIYSLPEGYRIVLSLVLFEGYDHEEIAGILGISNSTSRTQYHRAKKKLLEQLKKMNKIHE